LLTGEKSIHNQFCYGSFSICGGHFGFMQISQIPVMGFLGTLDIVFDRPFRGGQ
jgi:hypothetical protein